MRGYQDVLPLSSMRTKALSSVKEITVPVRSRTESLPLIIWRLQYATRIVGVSIMIVFSILSQFDVYRVCIYKVRRALVRKVQQLSLYVNKMQNHTIFLCTFC